MNVKLTGQNIHHPLVDETLRLSNLNETDPIQEGGFHACHSRVDFAWAWRGSMNQLSEGCAGDYCLEGGRTYHLPKSACRELCRDREVRQIVVEETEVLVCPKRDFDPEKASYVVH